MPRSIDRRAVLLGLAALALVTFEETGAGAQGSSARAGRDGAIAVTAVYVAPETCWSVAATGPGAPAGTEPGPDGVAALVTVERLGDLCGQALTPLEARFAVPDRAGARVVIVYVVDKTGRLLKSERVPIRR